MVTALSDRFDGFVSSGESGICCRESSGSDVYRSSRDSRPATPVDTDRSPKLLDRLKESHRARHYSPRTENTYC